MKLAILGIFAVGLYLLVVANFVALFLAAGGWWWYSDMAVDERLLWVLTHGILVLSGAVQQVSSK